MKYNLGFAMKMIKNGQAKVKEYEHQIDQLVYKLYDLTEDEIKIVENK